MAEDAAPQRTHVGKERVTVMEQEMEDRTMETKDAAEILSVEVTTVHSLVHTTTRKMTVVRGHHPYLQQHLDLGSRSKDGAPGPSLAPALPPVGRVGR